MKNTKHLFARIIAVALIVMMIVPAAITAMASTENPNEPPFTITINNNEGLPAMVDSQFSAYQIFTGKPYQNGTGRDEFGNTFNKYSLADIQWGASVITSKTTGEVPPTKTQTIAQALKATESFAVRDAFRNISDIASAAEIAAVLAKPENANNTFLQAFSAFLVGSGAGKPDSWLKESALVTVGSEADQKTYTYPKTSTANAGTLPAASDDCSTITVEQAGYYLIVETTVPTVEGASAVESEYILAVLGDQTINIKANVPTVDKDITDPGAYGNENGDSVGLGDHVKFTLTGTLPSNFDDYKLETDESVFNEWYYYSFTDTLSKGLTYDTDSLKVYIVNGAAKKEVALDSVTSANWVENHAAKGPFPRLSTSTDTAGTTTIIIDMGDLKLGYADNDFAINKGTEIVVEYTATVNDDAVIGVEGNPNTVKLTYSNDPNREESMGYTPEVTVRVYTFNLELEKVAQNEHATKLAGARFYLTKQGSDGTYYYCKTGDNYEWVKEETGGKRPGNAVQLETNDQGKFTENVTGLDADVEYTLTEIIAPDGYNTIDPIVFSFTVDIAETGELQDITLTPDSSRDGLTWYVSTLTPGSSDITASLSVIVEDPEAPFLPFTGGAGTVIFYVVGGLMIAGVAFYIALSGKKNKKEQKEN